MIRTGCVSVPGMNCFRGRTGRRQAEHGTFRDVIAHLPYVASMGFDVLYMPPIHPVGTAFRKGKNNHETR